MNKLPILVPAMLWLAACTPTATEAPGAAPTAAGEATPPASAPTPLPASPASAGAEPKATASNNAPAAGSANASISGGINNGNRAPPALRVCATPVAGGTATCIDTRDGASDYRIDVSPGRYYLLGWAKSGELTLIAHASQIRCIRAPCPPDELITVDVAAGQQRTGIDLNGAYVDIPQGWPKQQD
ncbi:MAG: hypothetical protein ABIP16_05830 [Thermomonas sp.]